MPRQTQAALGLLLLLGVTLVVVLGRSRRVPEYAPTPATSVSAPPPSASSAPAPPPDAEPAPPEPEGGAREGHRFDLLPDGGKPELPDGAPKTVGFGVVLFSYAGAEAAPAGARSKEAAREKALGVVAEATRDFAAAVAKGDRGSKRDAGRVPRGVLEPVVEYLLFTLGKGDVYPEPIDTPRGYWIVRRND